MHNTTALEFLNSLADGFDPETGEVLPRDHVLQQPNVIRALGRAVKVYREYVGAKKHKPARAGVAWTVEEDEQLLEAYDRSVAIKDLAANHE